MISPSPALAARRRRLLLWLPLLIVGAAVSLFAGPLVTGVNSLDIAGVIFLSVGVLGFVREMDK